MLRFLKGGGWIIPAALILIGWLRAEINAAEARGEAQELARVADSAFQALQDSVDAWAARQSAWDSAYTALTDDLQAARGAMRAARAGTLEVVAAARSRVRALLDSMAVLTAGDAEVIAAGIDSLEESERLCNQALGVCEELVDAANTRIWDLEAQQRQSVDLNRQQAVTIDRLQNVRGPSIGTAGYLGWTVAVVATVLHFVR